MASQTISKLSYPYPLGFKAVESFKPKATPNRYDSNYQLLRSTRKFNWSFFSHLKVPIEENTTYALSYMPPALPVKEQYPWARRHYRKSNVPIASDTTNKLSYMRPALPVKQQYPWAMRKYVKSDIAMVNDTIQKLSYMPPGEFVRVGGCNCLYSGKLMNDAFTN